MPSLAAYIDSLLAHGRETFTTEQAASALAVSPAAARATIRRLKRERGVADPYRGFHVSAPPQHRHRDCRSAVRGPRHLARQAPAPAQGWSGQQRWTSCSARSSARSQRKKGRDRLDSRTALGRREVGAARVIACFERYMQEGGHAPSRAQVEANLDAKAPSRAFRGDIAPLLRPGTDRDFDGAMEAVLDHVVSGLPGEAWRGAGPSTATNSLLDRER